MKLIKADWPAPDNIHAVTTTRDGGVSMAPYAGLNLGAHVGDDINAVSDNRKQLRHQLALPNEPVWLSQTHSTDVADLDNLTPNLHADASTTSQTNIICAVLTADCLPILICDKQGQEVAAIHAGWRGLAAGIVDETLARLKSPAHECLAWMGPAIGASSFEVGHDVIDAYLAQSAEHRSAFRPAGEKFLADIYQLAKTNLQMAGLNAIYGGQHCTYQQSEQFFSYRRDGVTGRMASLIWRAGK